MAKRATAVEAENAGTIPSPPPGAHEWLSFPDPDEDRTWVFDITFLLSSWDCIFGRGCQGVLTGPAEELVQGCCSYGAHFTGPDDVERVKLAAATLGPDEWQFAERARTPSGKLKIASRSKSGTSTPAGEIVSRIVDDACIFLNRPGFSGGPGCALHAAALRRGERPMDLKPDVCWQLPLRREDETDATGHVTSTLRQWDRRHWGEGGQEFHWWCTESPEAFIGKRAVYQSLRAELIELVGEAIYETVASDLERRQVPTAALPHPAVPVSPPRRRRPAQTSG